MGQCVILSTCVNSNGFFFGDSASFQDLPMTFGTAPSFHVSDVMKTVKNKNPDNTDRSPPGNVRPEETEDLLS